MTGLKSNHKEHTFVRKDMLSMWNQKRGKKYRFFDQYKDPLTNKIKVVSVTMPDKKKHTAREAQLILNNKINKLISQVRKTKVIHGVTLENLLSEYISNEAKRVRRSTYYNHKTMQQTLLKIFSPDTLVENMTPMIITKKLEELMYGERHLSSGYVSKFKYFVHAIFDYAVEHSYIKNNPVNEVKLNYPSPVGGQKIRDKFLEEAELTDLLRYSYNRNETYGQLFEWLYLTGSRIGEATALSFQDVHQEGNHWIVNITGTLDYDHVKISNQRKSEHTKTASSTRSIILPEKAVQIYLKRLHDSISPQDFIFTTTNNTPIQTSAVNTFLRTAKKNLGINKPLSSHIFRHTHISKLAELGVPLYVIQQRVGHSNGNITRQIYLHVTQKAIEQEAGKLDEL